MNKYIVIDEIKTAEELFKKISIEGEYKDFFSGNYLFRGQSSDKYKLVPSISRQQNLHYLYRDYELTEKDFIRNLKALKIEREKMFLNDFWSECDEVGLKVPNCESAQNQKNDFNTFLLTTDKYMKNYNAISEKIKTWPDEEYKILSVLAQHYDIPTRMLDWTKNVFIGLYFACSSAANKDPDDKIVLWVLNKSIIDDTNTAIRIMNDDIDNIEINHNVKSEEKSKIEKSIDLGILQCSLENHKIYEFNRKVKNKKIYTIPISFIQPNYSDNANLKAQKGVLSYEEETYTMKDFLRNGARFIAPYAIRKGIIPEKNIINVLEEELSLDEKIKIFLEDDQIKDVIENQGPILYKILISQKEYMKVLKKLHCLGYDGATLFPGYYGVKRKLDEKKLLRDLK